MTRGTPFMDTSIFFHTWDSTWDDPSPSPNQPVLGMTTTKLEKTHAVKLSLRANKTLQDSDAPTLVGAGEDM